MNPGELFEMEMLNGRTLQWSFHLGIITEIRSDQARPPCYTEVRYYCGGRFHSASLTGAARNIDRGKWSLVQECP